MTLGDAVRRTRRRILTALVAFGLAGAMAGVLPAAPALATGEGVDMDLACQIVNGPGWAARLFYPNQGAYGWKCTIHPYDVVHRDVDVNNYCQYFYSEWAHNTGGAYSWYCA